MTKSLPSRPPRKRRTLAQRIGQVEQTLADLRALPPALGTKWREGMVKYFEGVLSELQTLRMAELAQLRRRKGKG